MGAPTPPPGARTSDCLCACSSISFCVLPARAGKPPVCKWPSSRRARCHSGGPGFGSELLLFHLEKVESFFFNVLGGAQKKRSCALSPRTQQGSRKVARACATSIAVRWRSPHQLPEQQRWGPSSTHRRPRQLLLARKAPAMRCLITLKPARAVKEFMRARGSMLSAPATMNLSSIPRGPGRSSSLGAVNPLVILRDHHAQLITCECSSLHNRCVPVLPLTGNQWLQLAQQAMQTHLRGGVAE